MKTIRITETFDGFPNGKDEVRFTKGEEPTVSNAFADLITGKGLATEISQSGPDAGNTNKESEA